MFKTFTEEININGKKITLETGKVARQADGAVIASCGETVVLATAVGAKKINEGQDYFPLSSIIKKNIMQLVKFQEGISKEKQDPLKLKP